jgi:hypothetical protein
MLFRILLIFLITLFQSNSYSDPFTNEIGITRQPEVVEVKPEETIEAEEELIAENDNNDQEMTEEQPIEAEEIIEVAEAEPQDTELVTILNIDPIVAYSLKDYLLKGVALSKESEHKFQRAKI